MSNHSPVSLSPKKLVVMAAAALALGGVVAAPAHAVVTDGSPTTPVVSTSHLLTGVQNIESNARTRIIWVF